MTTDEIIAAIWELPFYKVAWIAVADDFILLYKLWPFWLILIVGGLFYAAVQRYER